MKISQIITVKSRDLRNLNAHQVLIAFNRMGYHATVVWGTSGLIPDTTGQIEQKI